MKNTFGFIGTGNMGSALVRAAAKTMSGADITLSDQSVEKAEALAKELGCKAASVEAVAAGSGYIFLGVKPQVLASLLADIGPVLAKREDGFVLVSMAAGVAIEDIRRMAGGDYPVIRIMPNTPVAVGCGMILYDATENVTDAQLARFCENMGQAGLLDRVPEKLIDGGSAISGCGPAFACLFLEALADGAVACGLPRDKALVYGAQTMLGTARLVMESGQHPGALKDAVCSPGGSTIAGVGALEEGGFRGSAMNAVIAAYRRTKELGK